MKNMLVIGGRDAFIDAALRIKEIDSTAAVSVMATDANPNFSLRGFNRWKHPTGLPQLMKESECMMGSVGGAIAIRVENDEFETGPASIVREGCE